MSLPLQSPNVDPSESSNSAPRILIEQLRWSQTDHVPIECDRARNVFGHIADEVHSRHSKFVCHAAVVCAARCGFLRLRRQTTAPMSTLLAALSFVAGVGLAAAPDLAGSSKRHLHRRDGHPFTALPSLDGATIFVSVLRDHASERYSRRPPSEWIVSRRRVRSGRWFADRTRVNARRPYVAGGEPTIVTPPSRQRQQNATKSLRSRTFATTSPRCDRGRPSSDGTHAFFSDEEDDEHRGRDVQKPATAGGSGVDIHRPVSLPSDRPVGMALSPDGHRLYVTSEVATTRPAQMRAGRGTPAASPLSTSPPP